MLTIDDLAQEIRRVDGNHSLGAGALAEALMPFLTAALSEQAQTVEVKESEWHRADRPGGGSIMLYTLREEGRRRGEPVMTNDVMINIDRGAGSSTDIEPIVQRIRSALVDVPAVEPVGCACCGKSFEGEGPHCRCAYTHRDWKKNSMERPHRVTNYGLSHREREDSADVDATEKARALANALLLNYSGFEDGDGNEAPELAMARDILATTRGGEP